MAYYCGKIEHDTGIHADAEQAVTGQQMLMVNITIAEYRDLVADKAKADYVLKTKEAELNECKQKLYDALRAMEDYKPMTDEQKEELRKLCGDWTIKKS